MSSYQERWNVFLLSPNRDGITNRSGGGTKTLPQPPTGLRRLNISKRTRCIVEAQQQVWQGTCTLILCEGFEHGAISRSDSYSTLVQVVCPSFDVPQYKTLYRTSLCFVLARASWLWPELSWIESFGDASSPICVAVVVGQWTVVRVYLEVCNLWSMLNQDSSEGRNHVQYVLCCTILCHVLYLHYIHWQHLPHK